MVTTTHDPDGGGRPRLIFAMGDSAPAGAKQSEFDLVRGGVTVIGGGPDADLRLDGLDERHAEIRRDEHDEYLFVDLGSAGGSLVDGQPMAEQGGQSLHTGDRIKLGDYTMTFYREEFADHGRPDGGRQGGELSGHPGSQ
jgi:pSer/pThr/pTyr-binding forkhead associated (FHA) protein